MAPSPTAGSHQSPPLYVDDRFVLVMPDAEMTIVTRQVGVGWVPPSANDILSVTADPETDPGDGSGLHLVTRGARLSARRRRESHSSETVFGTTAVISSP